jgi:hypothetical protein
VTEKEAPGQRSIRTPLVLAVASAMVSIGLAAALGPTLFERGQTPDAERLPELHVDATTPEAAAESYLDAYRRREHRTALSLSVGDARAQASARMERDQRATPEERAAKERIWDPMAAPRLAFVVTDREPRDDDRVALRGRAEGSFLEQPYIREVSFEVVREGEAWRVARMELGDVVVGPRIAGEVTP